MRTLWKKSTRAIAATLLETSLALSGCTALNTAADTESTQTETASSSADDTTTTAETIADTRAAAEEFLATLSDEQQKDLVYDFDDETKTTSWSNFPVTFVDRAGLNLADLDDEQRAAALKVLEALLSEEGYATATGIMDGDEFLLKNSDSTEDSLGQYYLAFFGDPSDTSAWELQWGGHHLGINATMDGGADDITFAPHAPRLTTGRLYE